MGKRHIVLRARYARKLAYAASDDGEESCATYIAMLEFRQRRDGPPVYYALYRRVMYYKGYHGRDESRILYLKPQGTWEEMVARYWLFPPNGTDKNDFPGYESKRWVTTTTWLDLVGGGGWFEHGDYDYQSGKPGRWIRIGTPSPWKSHRQKKPLCFGTPQHIVHKLKTELAAIKREMEELRNKQDDTGVTDDDSENYFLPNDALVEYETLGEQIESLERECITRGNRIAYYTELMRKEVRSKFPEPKGLTPKRIRRRNERRGTSSIFG